MITETEAEVNATGQSFNMHLILRIMSHIVSAISSCSGDQQPPTQLPMEQACRSRFASHLR
jgi:hypothetical protein